MSRYIPALTYTLALLWAITIAPASLHAHGIFIYGWDETGSVCSESYYAHDKPVVHATVSFITPDGTQITSGVTNAQGIFCAPVDASVQQLTLTVLAEGGHKAQYLLNRSISVVSSASQTVSQPAETHQAEAKAAKAQRLTETEAQRLTETEAQRLIETEKPYPTNTTDTDTTGFTAEQQQAIRQIIQETVQQEVRPLQRMIIDLHKATFAPSLQTIGGGIGWIIGICALAFFWMQRKKKE